MRDFFLPLLFIALVTSFSIPSTAYAQAPSPIKTQSVAVDATVATDNANVYAQPDFDSALIGHLQAGQAVRVSRGMAGDQIKFHKVRIGDKIGYIADIDVKIEGVKPPKKKKFGEDAVSAKNPSKDNQDHAKTKPKAKDHDKDQSKEEAKEREREKRLLAEPMFFSRFVGILLGETWFKEGITGVNAGATVTTYGLKITGPGILFNGPVMDLNFAFHYGAPSYYQPLSSTSPSGFLLLADGLFLVPFVQDHNMNTYFGVGPLILLSDFKVTNSGRQMDLSTLTIGAAFSLGLAVRIQHAALRLEGKYYWEKQSYYAAQLALQTDY